MRLRGSNRLAFLTSLAFGVGLLAAAGCDDGDPSPSPVDMGDDGAGGNQPFGGMGGVGGEPFGGMGGDDVGGMGGEGGDMGMACECPGNQICDDAGDCIENPDGCGEDVDCIAPNICEEGACAPGCAGPADCVDHPNGPLCVEGRCGSCAGDDDCFGAATCVAGQCAPPANCTASRECGPGNVCDDGACVAAYDCAAAGCPGGFICGDDGDCRPLPGGERCEGDDAVCPLGTVCAGQPEICRACQDDAHCPGNQRCERLPDGNRCAEPEVCVDNTDCLGNRSCEGDRCAAPRCDDDRVGADNATVETAALIQGDFAYPSLINCGVEWFEFSLPEDTIATISVRQLNRDADLRLEAFAANGISIGVSSTGRPVETVIVGPFGSERPIRIKIDQVDIATVVEYGLEIGFSTRDDACVDDGFEAGPGDDDQASARYVRGPDDLAFDPVEGRLCPGDADWICFSMQARERLTINVEVSGAGTVSGELTRDGDNEDESEWTSGDENDPLVLPAAANGAYCLTLTADAAVSYRVDLQAVSPDVVQLCRATTPLGLDANGEATERGQLEDEDENVLSPSCATDPADGGEAAYTVDIGAPSLLIARARGAAGGTLGDPVISLRGDCESANSELACAAGWFDPGAPGLIEPNPAELRAAVEPGLYTIIVDGTRTGNRPTFNLEVSARRLAARPGNDSCENAEAVRLTDGEARLRLNLDQARDDTAGCLGRGAPDAIYSLSLDGPSRVRVDAAAQNNEFAVGAYLVQRCGDPMPVACGFGFDAMVPAGEWLLVVDGASANSRGRVEVDVLVEEFDGDPDNDDCGAAAALNPNVPVEGDTRGAGDDISLVAGNRCTGYDSRGGDLAYTADLDAGTQYFVEAVPEGGWDLSLIVTTDCGRADQSCVAGSDGALAESVVFTPANGGNHFIVVDGSAGEGGRFTLRYGEAECARDADCPDGSTCGPDYACIE